LPNEDISQVSHISYTRVGQDAYGFFLKSKLAEAELARIWDVCDKTKTGRLDKPEFGRAMWMIKQSMLAGAGSPSRTSVSSFTPAAPVDLMDFASASSSPVTSSCLFYILFSSPSCFVCCCQAD
jgi:hypothetical protein